MTTDNPEPVVAARLPPFTIRGLVGQGDEHAAFVSRLWGLFSEQFIRTWCACEWAPFELLGRPTLKKPDEGKGKGKTLDYLLRARDTGQVYVAEQKCLIHYEGYKWLVFDEGSADMVKPRPNRQQFGGDGFRRFLALAAGEEQFAVHYYDHRGRPQAVQPAGCILVWGSVSDRGRQVAMEELRMHGVISLEDVITALRHERPDSYRRLVSRYATWCAEVFAALSLPVQDADRPGISPPPSVPVVAS